MGASVHQLFKKYGLLLALCVGIFSVIHYKLFSPSENDAHLDLAQPWGESEQVAVPFNAEPVQSSKQFQFELTLKALKLAPVLAQTSEISLQFGTYSTRPTVLNGSIKISNSDCLFVLQQAHLIDNQMARFSRQKPCAQPSNSQGTVTVQLTLAGTDKLALWAGQTSSSAKTDDNPGLLITHENANLYAMGNMSLDAQSQSQMQTRIQKLSFLWGFGFTSHQLVFLIEILLGLWIVSLFFFLVENVGVTSLSTFAKIVVFTSLIMSSGGLIAILTPPLQAPDEPDHLMGYLQLTGQQSRFSDLEQLAKAGHFERIRFHSFQFFRSSDIDHPFPVAWSRKVQQTSPETRSSLVPWLWQIYDHLLSKSLNMGEIILSFRFLNIALWTFCLILPLILAGSMGSKAIHMSIKNMSWLIMIPVLPFFAMHVSDFSLSVAVATGMVLLLALVPQSKRIWPFAVLGGLFIQLSLTANKASAGALVVFIPLVWHALFCRMEPLSNVKQKARNLFKDATVFWLIAAAVSYLPLIPLQPMHMELLSKELGHFYSFVPVLKSFITVEKYRLLGVILASIGFMGYSLLVGMGLAYERLLQADIRGNVESFVRKSAYVLLAFIVAVPVYSFMASHLPHLQNIEIPVKPSFYVYFKNILKVIATSLRLTDFDFFMQTSFWGGFGWIDTIPGPFYLALQNCILIILTIHFVRYWQQARPVYGLAMLGLWLTASLSLVGFLAFNILSRGYNLHGRYLIPVYLFNLGFLLVRRPALQQENQPGLENLSIPNDKNLLIFPYFYSYIFLLLISRFLG